MQANTFKRALCAGAVIFAALSPFAAQAEEKKSFDIAWTIYAGWMPWQYADESGIMKKWADKYGIEVNITQINDYVESINQYTAGQFDGVVATSMDALSIPAAGGVDTTALIVGDYSNGNDGLVMKGSADLKSLKDQRGDERARRAGGEHLGCRPGRRLQHRRRAQRGDLESAAG